MHDAALDWKVIDANIIRLAGQKGELDLEIGRWLLAAREQGVAAKLGFSGFAEYVDARFGFDARKSYERIRVAEALEELPALTELVRSGQRSWSAARELTRVARPHNERQWIDASERLSSRQIEALVARRKPGDGPDSAREPLTTPQRVVFMLLPEDLALLREASERVRKENPAATQRDVLMAMVHSELGPRGETQPAFQTSLTVCIGCQRAWQHAAGEAIEVPEAVGECARCDSEVIGFTEIDEGPRAQGSEPDVAPSPSTHVGEIAERPAPAVAPSPGTHVGDDGERTLLDSLRAVVAKGGSRALVRVASRLVGGGELRGVTPKVRAFVRARDGHRCSVPGCNRTRFIDLHHLRFRGSERTHDPNNLTSLCSAHHRAYHEGTLAIEGSIETGLIFRHATGALYRANPAFAAPLNAS